MSGGYGFCRCAIGLRNSWTLNATSMAGLLMRRRTDSFCSRFRKRRRFALLSIGPASPRGKRAPASTAYGPAVRQHNHGRYLVPALRPKSSAPAKLASAMAPDRPPARPVTSRSFFPSRRSAHPDRAQSAGAVPPAELGYRPTPSDLQNPQTTAATCQTNLKQSSSALRYETQRNGHISHQLQRSTGAYPGNR